MDLISKQKLSIRWSDLDPVGHVRHSVYYDFCAQLRLIALDSIGLGIGQMQKLGIGPILFKEECSFRKEMHFGESIFVHLELSGLRKDFSRFAFKHTFIRGEDEFCAELSILGAWMDLRQRKLSAPPESFFPHFDSIPKSKDFTFDL
jgi:acyl-CoA thioester hydrolase